MTRRRLIAAAAPAVLAATPVAIAALPEQAPVADSQTELKVLRNLVEMQAAKITRLTVASQDCVWMREQMAKLDAKVRVLEVALHNARAEASLKGLDRNPSAEFAEYAKRKTSYGEIPEYWRYAKPVAEVTFKPKQKNLSIDEIVVLLNP